MTEFKINKGDHVTFVADEHDAKYFAMGCGYRIIRVEPAPFDWASVKPGDRFTYNGEYFWYVGPLKRKEFVCFEAKHGELCSFLKRIITPAPEGK